MSTDNRNHRSRCPGWRRTVWLAALVVGALGPGGASAQAPAGGRVRVLFLGDNGHHQPAVRAKEILPALAADGIDLFYTDALTDLRPGELAKYHALVLYNNHPAVSRSQLAALLGFVEQGGGLVVLHCASASFQNAEEFIRLVGAAFKSHGTGTFRAGRLRPEHPVLRDVPDFESWDETYVHTKHNPDRIVLEVRREAGHEEPWTWVRAYGRGRVFYTAWGHDQRTWGQNGFRKLVGNGIKWTAGDWALTQRLAEPTPAVVPLPVPLPIYRQDTVWNVLAETHVTREAVALPPEESLGLMTLRPGFAAQVFAAEPLINNIMDFTWDARGRLWAVEANDYPNVVLPDSVPGHDRILILEDTDGDGRADRRTVFAEGLNLATSLVLANGGVIVAQAPHMLFLPDRDGDDRADSRTILFSGWPRDDTHGTPSNLRRGLDNWIWGSVGYNGFRGTVGDVTWERGQFGAGYFRFPADGSTLDYVARTGNNTWGLGFTEEGYVFGSTANSQPSAFVPIPGRFYRRVGAPLLPLPRIDDRNDIYPLRAVYQVDQFGRYTAGAAHEIYTARAFPEEYWNRVAFVAEPTGHLVGMFELAPRGGGFTAKNRWNFLASRDAWVAPVQVKVGPDGAVWVSDFYTLVSQHNPTPEKLTPDCCVRGAGNAYQTPNRDTTRARIYRIVPQETGAPQRPRLDQAPVERLVEALRDDNLFWRLVAQQRLVEERRTEAIPALIRLADDPRVDPLGLNPGALHALWTLHGLGAIPADSAALAAGRRALHHPAASVRRAALQVLPRDGRLLEDLFRAGLLPDRTSPHPVEYTVGSQVLQDADPQVRLTALLTLAELPPSPRAAGAILDLIFVPGNARDPWLADAAAIAGVTQGADFLVRFLERNPPADSAARAGLRRAAVLMTRHYASAAATSPLVSALLAVPRAHPVIALGVLEAIAPPPLPEGRSRGGFGAGWPDDQPPSLTPEQRAALAAAARGAGPELVEAFARIGRRWGMPDLFGRAAPSGP